MKQEILPDTISAEARLRKHLAGSRAAAVSMQLPLLNDHTVSENIALARIVHWHQSPERAEAVAVAALARHGLAHIAGKLPPELTKAEIFLAQFLRAISMPHADVMLDRPVTDFGLTGNELVEIVAPYVKAFEECVVVELATGHLGPEVAT